LSFLIGLQTAASSRVHPQKAAKNAEPLKLRLVPSLTPNQTAVAVRTFRRCHHAVTGRASNSATTAIVNGNGSHTPVFTCHQ
jgi:hypothetical protein